MFKVLAFMFILIGQAYAIWGDSCPSRVRISPGTNSCKQVCEEVRKELSNQFELVSAIGTNQNLHNQDKVSYISGVCNCIYTMPGEVNLPVKALSCEYRVSFSASGGESLKINVDVDIPEDLPTKLVKTFSFQSPDPGLSGAAGIVFAGLYSAYVNAVRGIVAGSAMMVVIVVASFFVLATVSERVFDFLRDRIRVLSKDTGTEIARKFAYTMLAVIFFSLPVPTGSPALKLTKAREGDTKKIEEECQKAFRKLDSMGSQGQGGRRRMEEEENKEYRRKASERGCKEVADKVKEGKVYLPVAVGVVSSLINSGIKFAKQVSAITEGVVIAYMHYKIASAYKNLEILYNNPEGEKIKDAIVEEAKAKSKPIDTGGCVNGEDVCKAFNSMTEEERKMMVVTKGTYCIKVFSELAQTCSNRMGEAVGLSKHIEIESQSAEEAGAGRAQAFDTVMSTMGELRSGLTWMTPATLPLSMFLFQTALLVPPEKPSESAVAILTREKDGWTGRTREISSAVEGAVTDAIRDAKKVLGTVSWGDILHGKNRTQIAFNLGYVMGFVSIPPGSIFQSKLEKLFSAAGGTAAGIFSRIVAVPVLQKAIEFLSKAFAAGAADIAATMIAFVLTHGIVDTIPLIAVAIPLIFKFGGYLIDISKFILSLPFYGALAATKRFESETLSFFPIAIKLMLTPPVFAIAPLFGFTIAELTIFFLYKVPMLIISQALSALAINSVIVAFILGHTVAIMYIAASIAATIAAWETAKGFIDGVFEVLNRVLSFVSSSTSREIASAMTVLRTRMAMG